MAPIFDSTLTARPAPDAAAIKPVVVDVLDVEAYPPGVAHLFVELIADGLATGVRVPLMLIRGTQPGPVFGLTAGIHGNELNGIPVIHGLFAGLDPAALRGTVVGVVAINVPGLHRHERQFVDGTDLNRAMPGDPNGSVAQLFAHRLLHRIVHQFDYLLDLHTASFGRVNSLYVRADMNDECTATMAYLQRPQIIVHNTSSDRTLRAAAMEMGIPAITIEIGNPQRWQAAYAESAILGVRRVMTWAKMIAETDDAADEEAADDEGEEGAGAPIVCQRSSWMFTDRGGLLKVFPKLGQIVEQGERVALICDAFGVPIREYFAPRRGVVIGKSTNPVGYSGARILHLGEVAETVHDAVL